MNITVICVGKLKEKYYADACAEFVKRLSRYAQTKVLEVADEKAPESMSDAQKQQVKDAEGARMLERIQPGDYVIAMDLGGKALASDEMADFLQDRMNEGKSSVVFLIGGSLGLSQAALRRADYALCFGKNTFSHQIFRLMLLEQIYRCFKILRNEPYHK
ncbi:MAG: 23S rRNA (pseudouridine(1915)-N(3))-methyltransferase RlmH [Clostridia bacterium]|nr:23S rRNA (pseudouridine(1915)-N(3))-methyltransferase RlmH [Clostridia bacterium]